MVAQADNTLAYIRRKVRRLTASSSESSLLTSDIDTYINLFYSNDFPYGIKLDQMRSEYTFYTQPNIDRYPLDVNYNQGIRAPVYVDGILGSFYKDHLEFFNIWPKWPTLFQPIAGDGVTTAFNFTIQSPFLSKEVTLGGVSTTGVAIAVSDDGLGSLYVQVPNAVVSVPAYGAGYTTGPLTGRPIPGMYNKNTLNPGLTTPKYIGSVNYVTGVFSMDFALAGLIPAAGQSMTLFLSLYQTGKPYSLMFWNNEITIRPVPKLVHKITVEAYLTPTQFMATTDNPILNQWSKYIALGASIDILTDRQDFDGVAGLTPMFKNQEGLVLERQGVEEIGMRNSTIFCAGQQQAGNINGSQYY